MIIRQLADGTKIPALGLGVWKATPEQCYQAVLSALKLGYRRIDTARAYRNEAAVGQAIRDSGIPRQEIFVTSKLWNDHQGYDSALAAYERSTAELNIGPLDLYLIHFPVRDKRHDSWRALGELKAAGLVRAIGVSNYTVRHLQEMIDRGQSLPLVNQVEFHPYLPQVALLDFCQKHRIALEAYSPLAHGQKLSDPKLLKIAERYGKSPAQILIRWCLDKEVLVIPKSVNPERIRENFAVFDFQLQAADRQEIGRWDENLRTCWDPSDEP